MRLPDTDTEPWNDPNDREDEMHADACADACPCCGGPLVALGQLGNLVWSRCRCCGMDCNRPAPASEDSGADCVDLESPF